MVNLDKPNTTLVVEEILESLGRKMFKTQIDKGYDREIELQKLLDFDIWNTSLLVGGWVEPWIVKKY